MATAAHRKPSDGNNSARVLTSKWTILTVAAIAVVGAIAAAAIVSSHGSGRSATGAGGGGAGGSGATTTTTAPAPLRVVSLTPSSSAKSVATDRAITVTFSAPLAANAPDPTLSPTVVGHWVERDNQMIFHPRRGYVPSAKETVTVPSGLPAKEGSQTVTLTTAYTSSFDVRTGSFKRLQELLAELKYLPFTFTPSSVSTTADITSSASGSSTTPTTSTTSTAPTTSTSKAGSTKAAPSTTTTTVPPAPVSALDQEPTRAANVSVKAEAGTFAWAYPNIPSTLAAQWSEGSNNTITEGAVMAFEADQNLDVDGIAGPEVWTALLKAVAARKMDPLPYNYIEVSENLPETLSVWQDGSIVYSSPCNTGVPGAETALGTYPIYTHLPSTLMTGTDVDGSSYSVEVYNVGYFYDGDAVHGYPRASYGFPQSNGCVELPEAAAQQIFNDDENYYGVLVTVSPA